jgi:pimeloyl-ACP methyl ester carboxylesterase
VDGVSMMDGYLRRSGSMGRARYPALSDPCRLRPGSDVIALVVLWRLRYKLALRDLPEMFLIRGIVFSHEAVRDWETKLTPALAESLRRRRRGKAGRSWYASLPMSGLIHVARLGGVQSPGRSFAMNAITPSSKFSAGRLGASRSRSGLVAAARQGHADPVGRLDVARTIPRGQHVVIPDAGHFVVYEEPEKVTPLLPAFLDAPADQPTFATTLSGYHLGETQ